MSLQRKIQLILGLILIVLLCYRTIEQHTLQHESFTKLEIELSQDYPQHLMILFAQEQDKANWNFYNTIYPLKKERLYSFNLSPYPKARKFRLMFQQHLTDLEIENCYLINTLKDTIEIRVKDLLPGNEMHRYSASGNFTFSSDQNNAYLETRNIIVYDDEKSKIPLIVLSILLGALTPLLLSRDLIPSSIVGSDWKNLPHALFIISILLPHPSFNIALILGLAFSIRNFSFQRFYKNRINILFVLYFIWLFINDLFISPSGISNLKATDTYLPLFILPIYASCIESERFLKFFPVSVTLIGGWLVTSSLIDFIILRDTAVFSFELFGKYLHPVYFAYLIAFSIAFLLNTKQFSNKYILLFFLILLLIASGSKLVLLIVLAIIPFMFLNKKQKIIGILLMLITIVLFPPIQKRFLEIIHFRDLSIIKEATIENPNDSRINGLTLRLILWQEALESLDTPEKIVFGTGVDEYSKQILAEKVKERGLLNHTKYSWHNQYLETLAKSGIPGLFLLLFILTYALRKSILSQNKTFIFTLILLIFAMTTESVFERAGGIYIFGTIILFYLNTTNNENSPIRN